ncbi:MAG: GNAT family N-acetyltransferase [Planctomycetota bacterium]|nr:GNAT family N-acetyltransferase [Planctomycetota bacterium]
MSPPSLTIRPARAADAAAMVEIYRPHIEGSWASCELVTPTAAEMAARVAKAQERHDWLVAAAGDEVLGYAYGVTHRARAAYRFTVEVSAYLGASVQGRGVGKQLYERLFERLAELGYCNAVAGVTLPNDQSVAFHERLGFTPIGVFRRIGYKFGAWRDVAWYERPLRDGPPPGE